MIHGIERIFDGIALQIHDAGIDDFAFKDAGEIYVSPYMLEKIQAAKEGEKLRKVLCGIRKFVDYDAIRKIYEDL